MKTFSQIRATDPAFDRMIDALDNVFPVSKLDLFYRNAFEKRWRSLAKKVYESEAASRGRTLEQCEDAAMIGTIGEVVVAQLLSYVSDRVSLNEETRTGEYWWDVTAGIDTFDYKFEVKFQHKITSDGDGSEYGSGFSFEHPSMCETAHQNWRKWDFMLGYHTATVNDDLIVVPRMLLINEVFADLYRPSTANGGTYVQTSKARTRGQLLELNIGCGL